MRTRTNQELSLLRHALRVPARVAEFIQFSFSSEMPVNDASFGVFEFSSTGEVQ